MLLVNALLAVLTISAPAADTSQGLVFVIDHLDNRVEWTSSDRTETLTRHQAITKLQHLSTADDTSIELKHDSKWKNGRSYKVMQLMTGGRTFRIFFHCQKQGDDTVVNRIKVTEI